MRKLIATVAAALALAGVGLAVGTAASDAPAEASWSHPLLPYIEQDSLSKSVSV